MSKVNYPSLVREVGSWSEENKSAEKGPKLRVLPDQSEQILKDLRPICPNTIFID